MLLCLSRFERHADVFCIEFVPVMHADTTVCETVALLHLLRSAQF